MAIKGSDRRRACVQKLEKLRRERTLLCVVMDGETRQSQLAGPVRGWLSKPIGKQAEQAVRLVNPSVECPLDDGQAKLGPQLVQRAGEQNMEKSLVRQPPQGSCHKARRQRTQRWELAKATRSCRITRRPLIGAKQNGLQMDSGTGHLVGFTEQAMGEHKTMANGNALLGDKVLLLIVPAARGKLCSDRPECAEWILGRICIGPCESGCELLDGPHRHK